MSLILARQAVRFGVGVSRGGLWRSDAWAAHWGGTIFCSVAYIVG